MLQTFYQVDFINFQHNEGDFHICRTMDEVSKVLIAIESFLDSEPNEIETPYSIIIKPIVMTRNEYDNIIKEKYL